MTFSAVVGQHNGQFSAALVGVPEVSVVGSSRSDAIAGLKAEIQKRVEHGELVSLEIDSAGISGLAGKYADDASLQEIRDDAYTARDAECPRP